MDDDVIFTGERNVKNGVEKVSINHFGKELGQVEWMNLFS